MKYILIYLMIPFVMLVYTIEYRKMSKVNEMPKNRGFRIKGYTEDLKSFKIANDIAYRYNRNILLYLYLPICLFAMVFQYLSYNPTLIYVILASIFLITHIFSVYIIQKVIIKKITKKD